jgi:serine/threonine-protein kinase
MTSPPDRLFALFDDLVLLDAGARGTRIAALQAEDAALAKALADMLAADASDDGVLDRGIAAMASTIAESLSATPVGVPAPSAGRRVGPFTLQRLLGRGGMGEVWLAARDEGGFRQEVALKLLKRGMDSEDLLRRFVQERRILAVLSHPNIARFIDGGLGDDGAPWFAMEYVDGVALGEHARDRGLGVRERVVLVAEAAEAVAYAQNRLVVHRDLKPSNILVDGQGRVRLLDFGVAKLLDESPDAGATATGVRAMSPAYAAPEQILDEPVSAATDVYALGVVLYELLTDELPHQRASATLETLAERARGEAPERPSQRLRHSRATTATAPGGEANTAQRFARTIAGELDTIVLAALRREPERRYASAAAFADDLRRWLDGRPVAAQADTATYRMRKFVSRHRLAVGSASAVLLALVAGFGTALWQASVAREQAQRAEAQARRAEAIKDYFVGLFTQAGPNFSAAGAQLTVRDWLIDAGAHIDAALSDAPEARAEIRVTLGSALAEFGALAQARSQLEPAVDWLRANEPQPRHALVTALMELAQAARREERFDDAGSALAEALRELEADPDPLRRREQRQHVNTYLLTLASARGDYAAAERIGRAQIDDRVALWGADDPRLAADWNNLGQALSAQARHAQALEAFERALLLLRADPTLPESRQAYVLGGMARSELGRGRLGPAQALASRALEIARRTLGEQQVVTLRIRSILADVALARGDATGAFALAQSIAALPMPIDGEVARAAGLQAGEALLALGRIDEAKARLQTAAAAFDVPSIGGSPTTALRAQAAWALALARGGATDEAVAHAERLLPRVEAIDRGDWRGGALRMVLAEVLALRDPARAATLNEQGRTLWRAAWQGGDGAVGYTAHAPP